jgi:hypothetical protein
MNSGRCGAADRHEADAWQASEPGLPEFVIGDLSFVIGQSKTSSSMDSMKIGKSPIRNNKFFAPLAGGGD